MRILAIPIATLPLLMGCSVLDDLTASSGSRVRSYDPTRIYLDSEYVKIGHRDADRYVCLSGPLQCQDWGNDLECYCP
jgi:hypothetical protein